jgi:DNA-binding GntR family transcriptional regulator
MDIISSPSTRPTIAMLQTHSLTGVVQHEIERMILSGELSAGTRLNENALAAKLAVSRGPIREACRALAELGFVYLIPNRGVFVKRLDKTDAMEVYDLRAGLTGLAGSLLAPVATKQHIEQLQQLLDEMARAAKDADFAAFYLLNIDFHDVIVDATGNGRLIKMYRDLVKAFRLFRTHGLVEQEALMASNAEHRAIVTAIKSGDGRACYDVSFHHVANGKQRMLTALDKLTAEGEGDPERESVVRVGRKGRTATARIIAGETDESR